MVIFAFLQPSFGPFGGCRSAKKRAWPGVLRHQVALGGLILAYLFNKIKDLSLLGDNLHVFYAFRAAKLIFELRNGSI